MPKKDIERLFKEVGDLATRLHPDEELELENIRGNLKAAGIDTARLRERLHDSARELAQKQRLAGKPAPKYLQEVIDATGPAEQLSRDASKAIDKMRRWIKSFRTASGVSIAAWRLSTLTERAATCPTLIRSGSTSLSETERTSSTVA